MFYETKSNNHNLSYNPFKSAIVPRPIGWISTIGNEGVVNLAPFSYFNAVADIPPVIMFSSSFPKDKDIKDTVKNIELNGEFVINVATFALKDLMNLSSTALPYGISEPEKFNIEMIPSKIVKPPRVKASPINLECRYLKTVDIIVDQQHASSQIILGHVVGVHIDENVIVDGKIDITLLKPICRLGYNQYAVIDKFFTLTKP